MFICQLISSHLVWSFISSTTLSCILTVGGKCQTVKWKLSLRIPPGWKHDEHITTLWVNRGPPSFTLSMSCAVRLPSSPSLASSSVLVLSHRLVAIHISVVFVTESCVCWAAFTPPPPLPHPSTPLNLWPPQPYLPTLHTSCSVSFVHLWRQTPFSAAD